MSRVVPVLVVIVAARATFLHHTTTGTTRSPSPSLSKNWRLGVLGWKTNDKKCFRVIMVENHFKNILWIWRTACASACDIKPRSNSIHLKNEYSDAYSRTEEVVSKNEAVFQQPIITKIQHQNENDVSGSDVSMIHCGQFKTNPSVSPELKEIENNDWLAKQEDNSYEAAFPILLWFSYLFFDPSIATPCHWPACIPSLAPAPFGHLLNF